MGGEGRERGVGVESGCGGRGEGCDERRRGEWVWWEI